MRTSGGETLINWCGKWGMFEWKKGRACWAPPESYGLPGLIYAFVRRAASDNAFHFAQLHLVLGNVNGLLEQVASTCTSRAEQDSRSVPLSEHIVRSLILPCRDWQLVIRFFAHLCLFLRVVNEEVPTPAVDIILNEYIRLLEVGCSHCTRL